MRWLALCVVLAWATAAHALDTNDRLEFTLDGGEQVSGWFVRAEADAVVVSVAGLPTPTRVPLEIVTHVVRGGEIQPMEQFRSDVTQAHEAWKRWVLKPPPHPHGALLAVSSLIVPGSGHAFLGDSRGAWGYLIADLIFIGAGALELSNEQRLGVVVPLAGLSAMMRITSASDAVRTTNRRRRRLREARAILQSPTER